ncbi:MAG: hypothetical protein QW158_04035 [Nitrososphaerales archaeon]
MSQKFRIKFRIKTWQAGFVVGLLSALAQSIYNLMPKAVEGVAAYKLAPVAYGFCMFCHVRDIVNWFMRSFFSFMTPAPISTIIPTLTIVGLLIGAYISALSTKSFNVRKTINPGLAFVYGILVASFAAILGACPIRIALRAAYIDIIAYVGIAGMIIGAIAASEILLKRAGGD